LVWVRPKYGESGLADYTPPWEKREQRFEVLIGKKKLVEEASDQTLTVGGTARGKRFALSVPSRSKQ
jgi:hypothetical protein